MVGLQVPPLVTGNDDRSCRPWGALGRVAVIPEPVSPPGLQVRGKYPPKWYTAWCCTLVADFVHMLDTAWCCTLVAVSVHRLYVLVWLTPETGVLRALSGEESVLCTNTPSSDFTTSPANPVPIHRNSARPTITGAGGRSDFPDCCSRARFMSGEESEARSSVRVSGLVC